MYAVPKENSNIHHAYAIPLIEYFVFEQLSRLYLFDIGGLIAFSGLPMVLLLSLKKELCVAVPFGVRFPVK